MQRNNHTTDRHGFDYMANSGLEERSRDRIGILAACVLIFFLWVLQAWGIY